MKKIETRGRKKAVLAHQVWFRVSAEEKQQLQEEAEAKGGQLASHLRSIFLKGREAIDKENAEIAEALALIRSKGR